MYRDDIPGSNPGTPQPGNKPQPPRARREFNEMSHFGVKWTDPYKWIRGKDPDEWKEVMKNPDVLDPEIRDYLEAENAYFEAYEQNFHDLTKAVEGELISRVDPEDADVPMKDGDWEYWSEFRKGGNYPVFKRRHIKDGDPGYGKEETLFDGDKEAKGLDHFDLAGLARSPDDKYLAYALDTKGSEYYEIRVRDLSTGQDLPDVIADSSGDMVWSKSGDKLYYIEMDDNHRPKHVKVHEFGTDPDNDPVIYTEDDPGYFLGIGKSFSEEYIFITAAAKETDECRILPSDAPIGATPTLFREREEGVEYSLEHHGDHFYIHTNKDGATEFKLMRTPIDAPGEENWEEIIPHDPDTTILGVTTYQDHMVRMQRHNALPQIIVSDHDGKNEWTVDFPDPVFAIGMNEGYEFDGHTLRVNYTTPAKPKVVYDVDLQTGDKDIRKTKELPNGHDPDEYIVERQTVTARDGKAEIPVTLLRHKSVEPDGHAPLFLYGYGSYGMSFPASFGSSRFPLVDRGAIYAVAHVRGGSEKGEHWYKDGKMDKKMNTFTDFVDVAEELCERGYGEKGKIVIEGASAGGMLVGAVTNMRPDLFTGVVAGVPFVDVLNTMMDETLPLTPPEWVEWGNPIKDENIFHLIKSYSPYDNIDPQADYPAILATAGLTDPRVTYWEPTKWVARLREEAKGGPFYLKTEMGAGHFGATARYESLTKIAPEISFAIHQFEQAGYDMSLRVTYASPAAGQGNRSDPSDQGGKTPQF